MTSRRSGCLSSFAFSLCARRSRLVIASLLLLPLSGCGPHRVRTDFRTYESAYADTSNREMLLNLARLENRAPTYFFKLGQITSSYRIQGSLSANGQLSSSSGAVQIPTGGGTPGLIWENDPTFQFIPVNDDTNAQLLLRPIPPETFYILYQQGWRVDQLFRLLVDRIEIARTVTHTVGKDGATSETCQVETIRNAVPTSWSTPADQAALSRYVTFLRISALVYELQRRGILLLRGRESFVPYDADAVLPADSAPPRQSAANNRPAPQSSDVIRAQDQNDAIAKNNIWRKTDKGWQLGHKVFTPVFYLSPIAKVTAADGSVTYVSDTKQIAQELQDALDDSDSLGALSSGNALPNMLTVLSQGFSLEGAPTADQEQDVCPSSGIAAHLVLRSMIGLMSAAAQEQLPFQNLATQDPLVPANPLETAPGQHAPPQLHFHEEVPPVEQIPLLRLSWEHEDDLTSAVVRVSYQDHDYLIADPKNAVALGGGVSTAIPQDNAWNRDMFRLINDLTSQVTVDISKFPLPEILQLHSD